MTQEEGCAVICDSAGSLLFYTNGVYVWNVLHDTMPNGFGLWGNWSTTQSALIVPQPKSDSIYYILTPDMRAGALGTYGGLSYSIVDMSLDSGRGDVMVKNVPLVTPTTEQVSAVKNCDNENIWVLTRGWNNDAFYAFLVTANGIDTVPVLSNVGTVATGSTANTIGYLKFSPDGKKIARAMWQLGAEVYDFNSTTGVVSNPVDLPGNGFPSMSYGVEFSPDGTKLYLQKGTGLFQYDLSLDSAAAIISSKVTVEPDTIFGGYSSKMALQLAKDKKIYVAHNVNQTILGVINNPDSGGLACNYQDTGLVLSSGLCMMGLPNFVTSRFRTTPNFCITYNSPCFGDSVFLAMTDTVGVDSALWDFGDTVSGSANISSELFPEHLFSDTGFFQVQLTVWFQGMSHTVTDSIYIFPAPSPFSLGNDTILCPLSTLLLYSTEADSFLWQDNSTDSVFLVTGPGTYWVKASAGYCYQSDTVTIDYISYPSVFLGSDTVLCNGDSLTLNAANDNAAYLWQDGNTDSLYVVSGAGTYWVEITNECGTISDTVGVNSQYPPDVTLGNDTTLCYGAFLTLDAAHPGSAYSWSTGDTTQTITTDAPGTYYVEVSQQGCMGYDTIAVSQKPEIIVTLGNDTVNCTQNPLELDAGNPMGAWLWSTGDTTQAISIESTGLYYVTVFRDSCSNADTIKIIQSQLNAGVLNQDDTIMAGNSLPLSASVMGATAYSWSPANAGLSCTPCLNPVASPEETTVYTFSAFDTNGCSLTDTVTISVDDTRTIFVSDIFSPNHDGNNDVLYVQGKGIAAINFAVYDRWGEKVFETDDKLRGWDGTFRGEPLNAGVYVYSVTGSFTNGVPIYKKGDITLVR